MVKTAHYRLLIYADKGVLRCESLAKKLGISVNTVKKYLRLLEREGMIKASGIDAYVLTNRGMLLLKSLKNIAGATPPPYRVVDPISGELIPITIKNYLQLYVVIKYGLIPEDAVNAYIKSGDLIKWFEQHVGDLYLAEEVKKGRIKSARDLVEYLEKVINLMRELN